ncbi:MAG: hypothetical protein QM778_28735 [Myxococcales bacterium]
MSTSRRRGFIPLVLLLVLAPVGLVGAVVYNKLFRREAPTFDQPSEMFKYGAFGNAENNGLPYYVWLVLPRVFSEYLPGNGGWASLGFVSEPGHETPIGFARETIGFERVTFNCALCHSASYRTSPNVPPQVALGGPGHQADTQSYLRFLFSAASDPRFNADVLLKEIKQSVDLSLTDELLYRYVLIPQTKKALLDQKEASTWMTKRPPWGPGRIDPFNPIKFGFLKIPFDDTIGNADNMAIWHLKSRQGQRLHWDGMNDSRKDVVLSSALGDGANLKTIRLDKLEVLEKWLVEVEPPKYPGKLDEALVSQGKALYGQLCADCHVEGGKRTGGVVPVTEIGTDGERHRLWTKESADAYNAFATNYPFKFNHFVGTNGPNDGYASLPLTGIWLRGPYMHNGSVPSLWDVLTEPYAASDVPAEASELSKALAGLTRPELRKHPAELKRVEALVKQAREANRRPPLFFRGYDVIDHERVGYVSDVGVLNEEAQPFLYDTSVRGNGNTGHVGAAYGTTLSVPEKTALIEYMKTL